MNSRIDSFVIFLVFSFVLGFTVGGWSIQWANNIDWRDKVIHHNAAHYDSITGDFQWNNEMSDK